MATKEAEIHDNVKQVMVKSDERNTVSQGRELSGILRVGLADRDLACVTFLQTHIFRTLRNTARVFKNKVAVEVVEKESKGAQFKDIQVSKASRPAFVSVLSVVLTSRRFRVSPWCQGSVASKSTSMVTSMQAYGPVASL